jgi:hypothetical protein
MLVGQLVPIRTTPDGRLLGWYRLGPASGPLPPQMRLEELDEEGTYVCHFIENGWVRLDVQAGDTKLVLPVGTATPVASVVDGLAVLLNLPAGDWSAWLDGKALEPFEILADRPAGRVLTLKKA